MQSAIEKAWVDILPEDRQGGNAHSVLDHHNQQTHNHENGLPPEGAQEEMPNDKRRYEQCHARSNTTAFFRDFDIKVRKMKHETFSKSRNTRKVKNHPCDVCGSLL
jgi:hypothetical protein